MNREPLAGEELWLYCRDVQGYLPVTFHEWTVVFGERRAYVSLRVEHRTVYERLRVQPRRLKTSDEVERWRIDEAERLAELRRRRHHLPQAGETWSDRNDIERRLWRVERVGGGGIVYLRDRKDPERKWRLPLDTWRDEPGRWKLVGNAPAEKETQPHHD